MSKAAEGQLLTGTKYQDLGHSQMPLHSFIYSVIHLACQPPPTEDLLCHWPCADTETTHSGSKVSSLNGSLHSGETQKQAD